MLKDKKNVNVINRGFRARNNAIFTYSQEKRGLHYFYCKRKILDDGMSTAPLEIVLCPWENIEEYAPMEIQEEDFV